MSGVDVRAVLDELVADMGEPLPGTTSHKLHQVRDAVAELIAAAQAHHAAFGADTPYIERRDARRKLGAALARCRGAER